MAIKQIETELGAPLNNFFSEFSSEPVAAASLAQVYKATTLDGEVVAVKIQRPNVLAGVSKDLYVLRRAAEVYQSLMDRFVPNQKTNYINLVNEFSIGFYTEVSERAFWKTSILAMKCAKWPTDIIMATSTHY